MPKIRAIDKRGAGTISSIIPKGILKRFAGWQDNTRIFVAFAFLINCFWVLALMQARFSLRYVPWLIVLLGAAFAWLILLLPARSSYTRFDFAPIRQDSGLSLSDWLAMTYSTFSLAMIFFILHLNGQDWHPLETRQVIDIQLISSCDYHDKKELLPSTEPKPFLRRRHGALIDQTADGKNVLGLSTPPRPSKPATRLITAERSPVAPERRTLKVRLRQRDSEPVFVIREQPKAREVVAQHTTMKATAWPVPATFVSHTVVVPHSANNGPIQMEEVAPAKLIEVTDNEGDNSADIWQAGGRSQSGKGARSLLANYLKELHQRLKRAWSPPAGTSSGKTEILFRLRKDGQLCLVKLATSSGDSSVDQSALSAISGCAPYPRLPSEYVQEYLDLRYTFNYTADELKPVDTLSINSTE